MQLPQLTHRPAGRSKAAPAAATRGREPLPPEAKPSIGQLAPSLFADLQ